MKIISNKPAQPRLTLADCKQGDIVEDSSLGVCLVWRGELGDGRHPDPDAEPVSYAMRKVIERDGISRATLFQLSTGLPWRGYGDRTIIRKFETMDLS